MRKFLLISMLTVGVMGCNQANRLVIKDDGNEEHIGRIVEALTKLESDDYLGCELYPVVVIGGKHDDWKRRNPPFGTVTIEFKPGKVPNHKDGHCTKLKNPGRSRIFLDEDASDATIAHEFMHGRTMEHTPHGLMDGSRGPSWYVTPSLIKKMRTYCATPVRATAKPIEDFEEIEGIGF